MNVNKFDFSELEWKLAGSGIREKYFIKNGQKLRLLELQHELEHPDWCTKGHVGLIIEGALEIIFADKTEFFNKGDALLIAAGDREKHIPKPQSEKVLLFLVEDI